MYHLPEGPLGFGNGGVVAELKFPGVFEVSGVFESFLLGMTYTLGSVLRDFRRDLEPPHLRMF